MAPSNSDSGGDNGSRRKPVFTRRMFTGSATVEAAVWPTTVGSGDSERETFNVTVQRSYKDPDTNDYKRTQSFWPQELPALALCVQDCALWIAEQDRKRQAGGPARSK